LIFVTLDPLKAIFHLGQWTNFCPYFLLVLPGFGDTGCNTCTCYRVCVSCISGQGALHFYCARKWNYLYSCTVKRYDILRADSSFVKSAFCITKCTVQSSCVCRLNGNKGRVWWVWVSIWWEC